MWQDCPYSKQSFREEQCSKYNAGNITWYPVYKRGMKMILSVDDLTVRQRQTACGLYLAVVEIQLDDIRMT